MDPPPAGPGDWKALELRYCLAYLQRMDLVAMAALVVPDVLFLEVLGALCVLPSLVFLVPLALLIDYA